MMLTRQIFETLPIALIALSLLFMALIHSPLALITGSTLIIVSCIAMYRRYVVLGTDHDVLDSTPAPTETF